MNRLDRLIIAARAVSNTGLELLPSIVIRNADRSWTAEVHLGDGIPGHQTVKRATYTTESAAIEYIRTVAEECQNSQDVPIIIIDV